MFQVIFEEGSFLASVFSDTLEGDLSMLIMESLLESDEREAYGEEVVGLTVRMKNEPLA